MKERIFIQKAKDQVSLEEFVRNYFKGAKCGSIDIEYTPVVTRIIIHTITPGIIVGQGGEKIREALKEIKKRFNLENPQIDVKKIDNPFLDPHIVAKNIAQALESNVNFKRLAEYYITRIMNAGAIGVELVFAGKIGGQRGRTERFIAGYLKKSGTSAEEDVVKALAIANPKLGNIGVSVKIMVKRSHQLKHPDEIVKERTSDKKS